MAKINRYANNTIIILQPKTATIFQNQFMDAILNKSIIKEPLRKPLTMQQSYVY
jgi:hypothetical protein